MACTKKIPNLKRVNPNQAAGPHSKDVEHDQFRGTDAVLPTQDCLPIKGVALKDMFSDRRGLQRQSNLPFWLPSQRRLQILTLEI
jgi:hypothetical protein